MKITYKGHLDDTVRPYSEWDWEVREAVRKALELVDGKQGFKTPFEIWRDCELIITVGHNIYTTSIEIRPSRMAVIKRRSNWHNGYAYYCNGVFWANISKIGVQLI